MTNEMKNVTVTVSVNIAAANAGEGSGEVRFNFNPFQLQEMTLAQNESPIDNNLTSDLMLDFNDILQVALLDFVANNS